jgi:hypothetical protein
LNIDPDIFADVDESAADVGCAAGFEMLHRYVESRLDGGDPAREFPGLATHLLRCPACRSDYEGLLEAAKHFGNVGPS